MFDALGLKNSKTKVQEHVAGEEFYNTFEPGDLLCLHRLSLL